MKKRMLVWGAGREGRGFLADLFHRDSRLLLVDANRELVEELNRRGRFTLHQFPGVGHPQESRVLEGLPAIHTGDGDIIDAIVEADGVFLCVYLEDMPAAADVLARGMEVRRARRPLSPLDLFICANSVHYAPTLKGLFRERLSEEGWAWFDRQAGVVETLVRRTCVTPPPHLLAEDPLCVCTNAFPVLLADGRAVKHDYSGHPYLQFTRDMAREVRLKLYTYNLLHAAYCYLGRPKGYRYLAECREDPAIQEVAQEAFARSREALCRRFSISQGEMEAYEQVMWRYVVTPAMRDRVDRAGYNPIRKLSYCERLIGPSLMCLEEGIDPRPIVEVVAAAFAYRDSSDAFSLRLGGLVEEKGIGAAVDSCCGLKEEDPLHRQLKEAICKAYEARTPCML